MAAELREASFGVSHTEVIDVEAFVRRSRMKAGKLERSKRSKRPTIARIDVCEVVDVDSPDKGESTPIPTSSRLEDESSRAQRKRPRSSPFNAEISTDSVTRRAKRPRIHGPHCQVSACHVLDDKHAQHSGKSPQEGFSFFTSPSRTIKDASPRNVESRATSSHDIDETPLIDVTTSRYES